MIIPVKPLNLNYSNHFRPGFPVGFLRSGQVAECGPLLPGEDFGNFRSSPSTGFSHEKQMEEFCLS